MIIKNAGLRIKNRVGVWEGITGLLLLFFVVRIDLIAYNYFIGLKHRSEL